MTAALAATLVFAAPGVAQEAPDPNAQALQRCGPANATIHGYCARYWTEYLNTSARISVYRGGKKRMITCDQDRLHGLGLAVQIDPSGPQAPITYWDKNGPGPGSDCTVNDIWYSVRKWRFVSVYQSNGRIHDASLPWEVFPLPHLDF